MQKRDTDMSHIMIMAYVYSSFKSFQHKVGASDL